MARFGRRGLPVVVPAVFVAHRCRSQFLVGRVEAREIDGEEFAAELRHAGPAERLDAAMPTEQVMNDVPAELILRQGIGTVLQPEEVRHDDRLPEAALAADRAVALAGAPVEIQVAL